MGQEHSANTRFKLSLPSHRMGRKREPSWAEAGREKSPKMSRGELEMGPTVRALVPQGRGQSDLALLCVLVHFLVNAKYDAEDELGRVTTGRGTGSGIQETPLMSPGPTKSYFKLERGEQL